MKRLIMKYLFDLLVLAARKSTTLYRFIVLLILSIAISFISAAAINFLRVKEIEVQSWNGQRAGGDLIVLKYASWCSASFMWIWSPYVKSSAGSERQGELGSVKVGETWLPGYYQMPTVAQWFPMNLPSNGNVWRFGFPVSAVGYRYVKLHQQPRKLYGLSDTNLFGIRLLYDFDLIPLAANVAIWWLTLFVLLLPFQVWRLICRLRRNHCADCLYPLDRVGRCVECGQVWSIASKTVA